MEKDIADLSKSELREAVIAIIKEDSHREKPLIGAVEKIRMLDTLFKSNQPAPDHPDDDS